MYKHTFFGSRLVAAIRAGLKLPVAVGSEEYKVFLTKKYRLLLAHMNIVGKILLRDTSPKKEIESFKIPLKKFISN